MFASSQSAVAGERTKLLRKWAKEEYADVVPRDVLRDAVENGVRKILTGGDPETAYGETVARIQLMTATMVERVRIEVVRGLRVAIEEGLAQLENEARENLRKLHDLGGVR